MRGPTLRLGGTGSPALSPLCELWCAGAVPLPGAVPALPDPTTSGAQNHHGLGPSAVPGWWGPCWSITPSTEGARGCWGSGEPTQPAPPCSARDVSPSWSPSVAVPALSDAPARAGMDFHKELHRIEAKEGLRGHKLQKALESFAWNITVLKVRGEGCASPPLHHHPTLPRGCSVSARVARPVQGVQAVHPVGGGRGSGWGWATCGRVWASPDALSPRRARLTSSSTLRPRRWTTCGRSTTRDSPVALAGTAQHRRSPPGSVPHWTPSPRRKEVVTWHRADPGLGLGGPDSASCFWSKCHAVGLEGTLAPRCLCACTPSLLCPTLLVNSALELGSCPAPGPGKIPLAGRALADPRPFLGTPLSCPWGLGAEGQEALGALAWAADVNSSFRETSGLVFQRKGVLSQAVGGGWSGSDWGCGVL